MKFFIYYLIAINLYGFILMYIDKEKSKKSKWRIPESKLLFIATILGSLGILLGMYIFRHKTKHKKFVYGVPFLIVTQLLIIIEVLKLKIVI